MADAPLPDGFGEDDDFPAHPQTRAPTVRNRTRAGTRPAAPRPVHFNSAIGIPLAAGTAGLPA